MGKPINLKLSEISSGAVQEKIDGELVKIFNNIHDLNTSATAKRTLTIKLEFVPDDARQVVSVKSDLSHKLAPVEGVTTTVLTGRDFETGRIEAQELKSSMPGQTYMDQDGQARTDVGEPIDVIEQEMEQQKQIIDFQQKRG